MTIMRILSLGAGVQSSTLLLMGLAGEVEIDCAIFADTQWEPKAVYEWLGFLQEQCAGKIPIHVVTAGSLRESALRIRKQSRHITLPYHVKAVSGEHQGLTIRQCTGDFKIDPIEKKLRELIGLVPRQRWPKHHAITQLIGISKDEPQRMRRSCRAATVIEHTLIDRNMTRLDCLIWMRAHGYPSPPKSSCIGCPFHSDEYWRSLPLEEFQDAVEFERELNRNEVKRVNFCETIDREALWKMKGGGLVPYKKQKAELRGSLWLHRSRKPLDTVDLTKPNEAVDMFQNECMGLCGN